MDDAAPMKMVMIPVGASPFLELLQLDRIELGTGRGRMQLVVQERHLRPLNIAHGGVVASLLDTVIGMTAHTLAPKDHYGVTVQLSVNFIRPAWQGETLIATSQTLHAGRQTAVGTGEVRTAEGILVATGSGTFMFLPHTDLTRSQLQRLDDKEIERSRDR